MATFVFCNRPVKDSWGQAGEMALVTVRRITSQILRDRYKNGDEPLTVLIVPGHDNEFPGAVYGKLRETDVNVELAGYLFNILRRDERFRPVLTRDIGRGNYLSSLEYFFTEERIRTRLAKAPLHQIAEGWFEREGPPPAAQSFKPSEENIFRLYAINKWAEEKDFDITIHIHFNDQYRKNTSAPGRFTGFSVFIPDKDSSHYQISKELAQAVYKSLSYSFSPSTAPGEAKGIIGSSELIALGANRSRYGAVFLVEYSYIYENIITNSSLRSLVLSEMARRTYVGLKDFFEDDVDEEELLKTLPFSYSWNKHFSGNEKNDPTIFLLKHYLAYEENTYPPRGLTARSCPLDGNYDNCLRRAVKSFQERYRENILTPINLYYGTGIAGPLTMEFIKNKKGSPAF